MVAKHIEKSGKILQHLRQTVPFTLKHQLWKGYFSHGWVSYVSILAVVLLSFQFYRYFNPDGSSRARKIMTQTALNAITKMVDTSQFATKPHIKVDSGNVSIDLNFDSQDDTARSKTDTAALSSGELPQSPMALSANEDHVDKEGIFSGGFKYMVLILLNMLIFHFCGRTIGIMGGVEKAISFKSYLKSQFRLLQVGVLSWAGEIVFGIGASILCGIFFNDGVESVLKKIIEMFFLGYFFFDGYYDYKGYKIKEAWQGIIQHAAPVIVVGAVTLLFLKLPYVGYFLSAYFCSVAATLYLIEQEGQNQAYTPESIA